MEDQPAVKIQKSVSNVEENASKVEGSIFNVDENASKLEGSNSNVDERILHAQGHAPQLQRSFNWLGALGFGYSISNTWISYAASFGIGLVYGGGVVVLSTIILAAIAQWIMFLGLAELCSAFPSSGGAYHFVYIIAPQRTKGFAAFVTGWFNILGWWFTTCSANIFVGISAFSVISLWYEDFSATQWQVYLFYLGIIVLSILPVLIIPQKHIDKMAATTMWMSFFGLFITVIVVVVMGRGHYQPGSFLTSWKGVTGWSVGQSWMLGIANATYCFYSIAASIHVAEEMPHPGRRIPQIINLTMLIGLVTVVPFIVTVLFCIRDVEAVQSSFNPMVEVFLQATGSRAAATVLQSCLTLLFFSACPSLWITCSRIVWAFSRDNGIPFAPYWQHVDEKRGIPLRTTFLSAVFCAIYGLIYIASTAAWGSIINSAALMMNLTLAIPQGILLTGGRSKLTARYFDLGKFGYAVNIFTVLWLIVSGVYFCTPSTNPTAVTSMNYNSVVVVGVAVLIGLLWLERRKKFSGPTVDLDLLNSLSKMS